MLLLWFLPQLKVAIPGPLGNRAARMGAMSRTRRSSAGVKPCGGADLP